MERSVIRDHLNGGGFPDFASLHPGYGLVGNATPYSAAAVRGRPT
jgi:hypothetical protein